MFVVALFLSVMLTAALLHAVVMSAMLKLAKVPIEEIGIGFGPKLAAIKVGPALLRFNLLLPLGAYVKLVPEHTRQLGRYGISIISLISPGLVSIVIAIALIGPQQTGDACVESIKLFFMGAAMPWSTGAEAWKAIYNAIQNQSITQTTGVMFAAMGAINLIPLPPMPGFNVVRPLFLDPRKEQADSVVMTVAILAMLLAYLSWLVALGVAVAQGN